MAEFNKHRMRAQIKKIIGHVHEARRRLGLADSHAKIIRNADQIEGIATLQLSPTLKELVDQLDRLNHSLTIYITSAVEVISTLESNMDNPNNTMPPERGRFTEIPNRTPLQRQLIREGKLAYSDLPTHYHQVPTDQNLKPRKPRKTTPMPKRKPNRKKRNEMPL